MTLCTDIFYIENIYLRGRIDNSATCRDDYAPRGPTTATRYDMMWSGPRGGGAVGGSEGCYSTMYNT